MKPTLIRKHKSYALPKTVESTGDAGLCGCVALIIYPSVDSPRRLTSMVCALPVGLASLRALREMGNVDVPDLPRRKRPLVRRTKQAAETKLILTKNGVGGVAAP